MATDRNQNFFLVNRWSPERGCVTPNGFQWIQERFEEGARHVQNITQKQRQLAQGRSKGKGKVSFLGFNRAGSSSFLGAGAMGTRGSSLGFARVTGGLEPSVKEETIEDAKEEVVGKGEEFAEKVEEVAKNLRVPVPETRLPFFGKVQSLVLKQLLCGIVAGGVAGTVVTPLEVVKTRVLAGSGGHTLGQVVNRVTQVEGVESVMKGSLVISIIRQALEKGVQFTTYEAVKRIEKRKHAKDPKVLPLPRGVSIGTLAGAAAGFTSTFFVYPFQVLADRFILNSDAYKGFTDAFFKIAKTEGWQELFRGINPALIRMIPSAGASFYTYESLKEQYLQEKGKLELDTWASLSIGAAAGAVATTLTYPLEVARKQISFSALPNGAINVGGNIQYNNTFQSLKGIVEREGLGGLYRGLPIEYIQIVPFTALSFAVYEVAKRAFVAVNEERGDEVKDGPEE